LLYLNGAPLTSDTAQSAKWNRGRYLVEGAGHCAECHAPRDILGGIVASKRLSGGPSPDGKGTVPNITQGGPLAHWSTSEIEAALVIGFTPDGDSLGGEMAKEVVNLGQSLSAIAEYIKRLPPIPSVAK
jgi:mono/diheme cytochrome c family protein